MKAFAFSGASQKRCSTTRPLQGPHPMPSTRFTRIVLLGAISAAVLFSQSPSRADLIFLKDGFILRGKVQREGKMVLDRTDDGAQLEWIPNGFFYMDDGARRVIFNPF